MKLVRHPWLKSLTDLLCVLLLVTLAARSEASCAPVVSDSIVQKGSMKNCGDMNSDWVGRIIPAPDQNTDRDHMPSCHLGCPVMVTLAATRDVKPVYLSGTYVSEREPRMIGISSVPQTPPPRFD